MHPKYVSKPKMYPNYVHKVSNSAKKYPYKTTYAKNVTKKCPNIWTYYQQLSVIIHFQKNLSKMCPKTWTNFGHFFGHCIIAHTSLTQPNFTKPRVKVIKGGFTPVWARLLDHSYVYPSCVISSDKIRMIFQKQIWLEYINILFLYPLPPCHCHKSADFVSFVCFLGTPSPHTGCLNKLQVNNDLTDGNQLYMTIL